MRSLIIVAFLVAIVVALLASCQADPIRSRPTDNPSISLQLMLTTPEGCRVYRFFDEYSRYVAVCPSGQASMSFDDVTSNGKVTTTTPQTIQTLRTFDNVFSRP